MAYVNNEGFLVVKNRLRESFCTFIRGKIDRSFMLKKFRNQVTENLHRQMVFYSKLFAPEDVFLRSQFMMSVGTVMDCHDDCKEHIDLVAHHLEASGYCFHVYDKKGMHHHLEMANRETDTLEAGVLHDVIENLRYKGFYKKSFDDFLTDSLINAIRIGRSKELRQDLDMHPLKNEPEALEIDMSDLFSHKADGRSKSH